MDFLFLVNIVALLFSFFVVGTILGAAFSKPLRQKIVTILHLERFFFPTELSLGKSPRNPILSPGKHPWTAEAVLNPAAIVLDDRTHLLFRAIGADGVSRFGYASSADGLVFDEHLPYPVYAARNPGGVAEHKRRYSPVMYPSGGSWGGAEDPRMVMIDDRVYVTFNMFENWLLRVGVISMSKEDFLTKHFEKWEGPYVISNTNREKNWMLFPEKIYGKFAVLIGIIDPDENRVRIEYTDDLKTLSQGTFKTIDPQTVPNKQIAWHTRVRSAGPPPIKTDRGWLVFYHAHDAKDVHHYKLGAMLLDLDDPTRVLHRAPMPVLSPDENYENDGKPGIVYACGAVIREGQIFVYYGGADKVVCVATAPLDAFLDALVKGSQPSLTMIQTQTN